MVNHQSTALNKDTLMPLSRYPSSQIRIQMIMFTYSELEASVIRIVLVTVSYNIILVTFQKSVVNER